MDLLSIISNVITIIAGIFTILSPFILDAIKVKNENKETDSKNSSIINIIFNSNHNMGKFKNTDSHDTIDDLYDYVISKYHSYKVNLKLIFLLSSITSLLNIILFTTFGEKIIFSSYINYVLEHSYKYQNSAYIISLMTIFVIYFSSSYFLMLFFYEKSIEKSVNNTFSVATKGKVEKISRKIFKNREIKPNNNFPSPVLIRIIKNLQIETNNKARRSKGANNPESDKNFLDSHKILTPLWFVFFINVFFYLFFSDKIGTYYISKIRSESIVFTDIKNDISYKISDAEKLKLIPIKYENSGVISFDILRKDGKFYTIDFNSIKTIEPSSNFTKTGEITENTHLRYTPHGYSGMIDNSNEPVLIYGENVRVHQNEKANNGEHTEGWALVLTNNGRQGFVYRDNLKIY